MKIIRGIITYFNKKSKPKNPTENEQTLISSKNLKQNKSRLQRLQGQKRKVKTTYSMYTHSYIEWNPNPAVGGSTPVQEKFVVSMSCQEILSTQCKDLMRLTQKQDNL